MKVESLKYALPAAMFLVLMAGAGRADEEREHRAVVRTEGLHGKIEYCTDCHGGSGQGYRGYFPIPRLAGQQPEYIENQLRAFVGHQRVREGLALAKIHGVNSSMRGALAAHFHHLSPRPFGGGPSELVARGRRLYQEGEPEANVPACAACHGPEAEGYGQNPRLAGQLYAYTAHRLGDLAHEHAGGDAAAIMMPIARSLSKSQKDAIAAYVGSLR